MGGDVYVESEGIGKGTTFIIQLRSISSVEKNSKFNSSMLEDPNRQDNQDIFLPRVFEENK